MFDKILDLVKKYPVIVIHRHKNPDGDALGSQIGLKHIIRDSFPDKTVYAVGDMTPRYAFMVDEPMDEIADEVYNNALAIVLDTSAKALISDDRYTLSPESARFDHHLFVEEICGTEHVDTSFESCCGLIASFAKECGLTVTETAAKALYTGMITDSGRFRFRSVSGDTMRLAGMLLDQGIDSDRLYAHLYMKDFESLKFQAYVYTHMKMTENGVAYLYVDKAMQEEYGLSLEDASASVSYMDSIKGCLCWIAFIETGDANNTIRVRLRSRFAPINHIAEQFRGGGHACASGATVYNEEELQQLVDMADAYIKEYKETHEGWL